MTPNLPKRILFLFVAVALSFGIAVTSALADQRDFEQCLQVFANGTPPVIQHQEEFQPRAFCFNSFAVLHSGKSRTPIYSAERLNMQALQSARNNQRTNKFFADARLPRAERAELEDYLGSGFDRGHMAPAGDMPNDESMAHSFSLANMIPQAPKNNRKAWAGIEKATRKYAMRAAGDVFVVTGPVFEGEPPTIGANRVWVPQHMFKLVYDPSANRAWAYWLDNRDDAKPERPISYAELVRRTRVEYLPGFKGE